MAGKECHNNTVEGVHRNSVCAIIGLPFANTLFKYVWV